jgi:hypothetical protein
MTQQRELARAAAEHSRDLLRCTLVANYQASNRRTADDRAREALLELSRAQERTRAAFHRHWRAMVSLMLLVAAGVAALYCWRLVLQRLWAVFPLSCPPEACVEAPIPASAPPAASSGGWFGGGGPSAVVSALLSPFTDGLAAVAGATRRLLPCFCLQPVVSAVKLVGAVVAVGAARILVSPTLGDAALATAVAALLGPALLEQAALSASRLPFAVLVAIAAAVAPPAMLRLLLPKGLRYALLPWLEPLPSQRDLAAMEQRALDAETHADLVAAGVMPVQATPATATATARSSPSLAGANPPANGSWRGAGDQIPLDAAGTRAETVLRRLQGEPRSVWLRVPLLYVGWPALAVAAGYVVGIWLASPSRSPWQDAAAHSEAVKAWAHRSALTLLGIHREGADTAIGR